MTESRSAIRERMLRAASAAWGYPDKIRESDFDPLLGLLMEVFSAELEKISNEIAMSRERVLQKIVQLLAPDVLTAPVPAHALLHVQGLGEKVLLTDREQFLLSGGGRNRQEESGFSAAGRTRQEELWFSPAGSYYVTDTAVKYMVMGERIIRYTQASVRENWWPLKGTVPAGTVWLGLQGSAAALAGTQFYFEYDHEKTAAAFYHHLPEAVWWYGERRLTIQPGFNSPGSGESMLQGWLQAPHAISLAADRLTQSLWQQRCVYIEAAEEEGAQQVPAELLGILPEPVAVQWAQEPLVWIRIEFPEAVRAAHWADLHCQANCIPVVNRRLHELTHRLREWINIIPLASEKGQQFLDLQSVTDQQGNSLMARREGEDDGITGRTAAGWNNEGRLNRVKEGGTGNGQEKKELTILLRKGGAGRFDERDARVVTEHLLQLLRDESAAFSQYNREFIAGEIRQVQQVINRISRQVGNRDTAADATPYLEVLGEGDPDNRHLSLSWWSTAGAAANQIRSGTSLTAYRNGGLRQGSIVLMTATQGGRNRLLPHESIPAYKSAVLSRDRVLSTEDIRILCIREMGTRSAAIAIRKGVMIAEGRQAGFVKTIDVGITLDGTDWERLLESGTAEHWQELLHRKLTERSLHFMPFRVKIKQYA